VTGRVDPARPVAKRVRRALGRRWRAVRRRLTLRAGRPPAYEKDYSLRAKAAPPPESWPTPPHVDDPFGVLHPDPGPNPEPRHFDVELFEALHAEYASRPVAPTALRYDLADISSRARQRLTGIHARIDLRNKTVLEVGCGSGVEVWHIAHVFGSDAWGIDNRPRRAWPTLQGDRVHLIDGDISTGGGLRSATFDRVISNTVWEHLEHPRAAFRETFRVMRPGGLAWIRANLYRGPTASHRTRDIAFPFPHLLFGDDVIAEAMRRRGKPAAGSAWVNRLTWEQYERIILEEGFRILSLRFDRYPLDEAFYARFEDVLGRYPRQDLERGFFTVILEKPPR
jgi:SAM-dependent methyltransferase